jgi:diguanylate cyclase (GGDEF)-like protein
MVDFTGLEITTPISTSDKQDKRSLSKRTSHEVSKEDLDTSKLNDSAFIMDFPAEELTPKVEAALSKIINEFNRQRKELSDSRDHVLFLEKQAEYHEFLPILSKRTLVGNLSRIIAYSERKSLLNGFIYIHIRNLGKIRRIHGHQAANHILTHTVNMLQNDLRASDVIGSLGGENFGIILTVTDAESVRDKAHELVSVLEAERVSWRGTFIGIEIWTGIHTFGSGQTPEEIIAVADKVLIGVAEKSFTAVSEAEVNNQTNISNEEAESKVNHSITSADILLINEVEAFSSK